MKIINFRDIVDLKISPEQCFQWANNMIFQKKESIMPAKLHMSMPGNVFCNIMPSIIRLSGIHIGGVKVVTRYPERKPSLDSKILLFNAENGEFLSLMDGNWITAMRTGAVATHSVVHLAKKGFQTIGMIGLGNVARATMLVLNTQYKHPLRIKLLRYKDQAENFQKRFATNTNLHFEIVDSVEECIKGSDVVISCATYFEDDLAGDDCFDEGVLVIPVHTRGFTNCDLFFDKVFADDKAHVDHFKYFDRWQYFAEVSDVINGRAVGRQNDKERILAYNIGVSIHDVYFAAQIYRLLKDDEVMFARLADADMDEPVNKFWV